MNNLPEQNTQWYSELQQYQYHQMQWCTPISWRIYPSLCFWSLLAATPRALWWLWRGSGGAGWVWATYELELRVDGAVTADREGAVKTVSVVDEAQLREITEHSFDQTCTAIGNFLSISNCPNLGQLLVLWVSS
ncbi:hypothetical protein C8R47DRAFT_1069222 [Mycena vitilis]|nr:hypothetical protein C8R47DRAFT_1069220 [Mycena vitilis]KAJ6497176.1 hypothetical protein C8R47DRAFT_1069221 [Mycena vitilis]KAJ6497177.1 hypothetical protein C8R47DRAFT_1069222 [Mycena vitilis]